MRRAAGLLIACVLTAGCSRPGGGTAGDLPPARPDLSGIWIGSPRSSLSTADPRATRPLGQEGDIPYAPWGLERIKNTRPTNGPNASLETTNDPSIRYLDPNGYPRSSIHPMRFKLVQTPDYMYQLWEYNQTWRQIAINKPHTPDLDLTWFGESVATWEGDTLVVDVTGFKDTTWLDALGHPHSEDLRIVERIRLADPDTLDFEMTFHDLKAYTKPWSATLTFKRATDGLMTENIYTPSEELRFRERFLGEEPCLAVRE